uniref:Uncharacterized protein n=1 Tax=Sipha flava TaxID=143950 RepID=A0A2S2QF97_9HEMI
MENLNNILLSPLLATVPVYSEPFFFLIHGTQDNAMEVRSLIVGHVVNDWTKFSLSHNRNGDNYSTANEYYADMIKNETYGGLCEFIAAGCIFPFNFKVYRNGILYTESGSNYCTVKLLRFGQDLPNGHFDAYLLTATENNTQSRIEKLVDEREYSPIASYYIYYTVTFLQTFHYPNQVKQINQFRPVENERLD